MTPDLQTAGREMHGLVRELYPICRSITGDGVRKTLARLKQEIPIEVHEVPTGTRVFDWTVPREWNIHGATLTGPGGEVIADFDACNLHVLNYSVPIQKSISLDQLKDHLFTVPEQPDVIPYRTSYYEENWGFCISHSAFERLTDGQYEVRIDSSLEAGHLTYGECFLPGESAEEVLVSCHICHPSLANDNLSGLAVATRLASELAGRAHRFGYRFLFIPGTIGSITWLARNRSRVGDIRHGLVLSCVGDPGNSTYKKSRRGNAVIDRAVQHVLRHSGAHYSVREFSPYGYDERQYCSPAFDLPVGCLTRTPYGEFPEYHTSADNPDFVTPQALADTLGKCLSVFDVLERDRPYRSLNPECEPQLGRRGLYRAMGGHPDTPQRELALLWVLNLADGQHSLLDIAERSELPFPAVADAAHMLERHDLLEPL